MLEQRPLLSHENAAGPFGMAMRIRPLLPTQVEPAEPAEPPPANASIAPPPEEPGVGSDPDVEQPEMAGSIGDEIVGPVRADAEIKFLPLTVTSPAESPGPPGPAQQPSIVVNHSWMTVNRYNETTVNKYSPVFAQIGIDGQRTPAGLQGTKPRTHRRGASARRSYGRPPTSALRMQWQGRHGPIRLTIDRDVAHAALRLSTLIVVLILFTIWGAHLL